MKRPRLPDLDRLSPAEKDALIVSLWETVQALDRDGPAGDAADVAGPSPAAPSGDAGRIEELRRRIGTAARSRRSQAPGGRAHWLSRVLDYRPLQILVILIAFAFLADFAIGRYQRHQSMERQAEARHLEQAASNGLFMELVRAGYDPGAGAYQATLRLQKIGAEDVLYVLQNPPRAFVQTGLTWQEVPSRAPGGKPWGVVKLEDGVDVTVLFDADIEDWSELIPGYMHVQLQFDQLISLSSDPGDDIVERNNRFYFYLKPRNADDEDIKRRSRFSGPPPAFIPMPPH